MTALLVTKTLISFPLIVYPAGNPICTVGYILEKNPVAIVLPSESFTLTLQGPDDADAITERMLNISGLAIENVATVAVLDVPIAEDC